MRAESLTGPAAARILIVLFVSCVLIAPARVGAYITSVEVDPSSPTVNDVVSVEVSGYFEDACWSVGQHQCGQVEGFSMNPAICGYDSWQPGWICIMMIVPYSFKCQYGTLPAGHYGVTFTEQHVSMRDPFWRQRSVQFDVVMPPAVEAVVDLHPNTLNLGASGKYVTCYVELPEEYDPEDIDVNTVMFNHTVSALPWPTEVGDHDLNGVPDRMVKFPRTEVAALLDRPEAPHALGAWCAPSGLPAGRADEVEVSVSGELADGTLFTGTDVIRVSHPEARRDGGPGLGVSSTDGGRRVLISFELEAGAFADVGIYDVTGRLVRTLVSGYETAGTHNVLWDGSTDDGQQVSAGIYFVRQECLGTPRVEKVVVVK